jgi:hypothetical protein
VASTLRDRINQLDDDFPEIVTLCGSTRFKQAFVEANYRLTMRGYVVISVGWFSHHDRETYYPTDDEKKALDRLHFRKIELADWIFVVNVGGYVGESTRNEIAYAESLGRTVVYLETPPEPEPGRSHLGGDVPANPAA